MDIPEGSYFVFEFESNHSDGYALALLQLKDSRLEEVTLDDQTIIDYLKKEGVKEVYSLHYYSDVAELFGFTLSYSESGSWYGYCGIYDRGIKDVKVKWCNKFRNEGIKLKRYDTS